MWFPLLCWCGGVWRAHNQSSLCSAGTNKCQKRAFPHKLAQIKRAPEIFAEEAMVAPSLIQYVDAVGGVSYGDGIFAPDAPCLADNGSCRSPPHPDHPRRNTPKRPLGTHARNRIHRPRAVESAAHDEHRALRQVC